MRSQAELFKAFADETRLKMLVILARHGELCVCDFEGALGLSQSTASRHLRRLYAAGLVDHRRRGPWVHYRLRDPLPPDRRAVLDALLAIVSRDQVDRLDARVRRWLDGRAATCSP